MNFKVLYFSASLILLFFCVLVHSSLYDANDNIILLDKTNFSENIFEKPTSYLVEFYSSWCGHCIRFAPIWKQLAQEVKAWKKVVQLAAIDCAADINLPICRDFDVQFYPTVRFFVPFSKTDNLGIQFPVNHNVTLLKLQLAQSALNVSHSWKADNQIRSVSDLSTSNHYAIITCVRNGDVALAYQLMLDLAESDDISVKWISEKDANKYGVNEHPALLLKLRDTKSLKTLAGPADGDKFLDILRDYFMKQPHLVSLPTVMVTTSLQQSQNPKSLLHHRFAAIVHEQDLESGLHYSLRREVAGSKQIEGEKLNALKAYVLVLSKYYPGRRVIVKYLDKVHTWLQAQNGPLSGNEWVSSLESLQSQDAYLPSLVRWTGCEGSQPRFRGYPCSLWTLFHSLTVNSVLISSYDGSFDPRVVLMAIANYLKHFFGCRECAEHFVHFALQMNTSVTAPSDSILFLWRAHNKANHRLHGDLSEDPEHPKLQFPPPDLCWNCYNITIQSWNMDNVLLYLKAIYSPTKLIHDSSGSYVPAKRRSDGTIIIDSAGGKDVSVRGIFSNIDIGICLLLYIACLAFLMATFLHVRYRRHNPLLPTFRRFCY